MNRTISCTFGLLAIVGVSLEGAGEELLINGSFEADGFTEIRLQTGWTDGAGLGFNVFEYPFGDCGDSWCEGGLPFEAPGPPNGGVSGPVGRGDVYAYALSSGREVDGEVVFSGHAEQHVHLTPHAGKSFAFSAWLASYIFNGDYPLITLEFFSSPGATGDSLGAVVFDGDDQQSGLIVGSANPDGFADPAVLATQDNWTLYRATGRIPSAATSASVFLEGKSANATSFVNWGLVDLVSLQVVPEPSSAVLACLLGAFGAVWHVRQKHSS